MVRPMDSPVAAPPPKLTEASALIVLILTLLKI